MIAASMAAIKWEQHMSIDGRSCYRVGVECHQTDTTEGALRIRIFKHYILLRYDASLIGK
jgi:hypothetical protein